MYTDAELDSMIRQFHDPEGENLTPQEEDALNLRHRHRQQEDPEHDLGGCFCCCHDCDLDT